MACMTIRTERRSCFVIKIVYIFCCASIASIKCEAMNCRNGGESDTDWELKDYVDRVLKVDEFSIMPGIGIEKVVNASRRNVVKNEKCDTARSTDSIGGYVERRIEEYSRTHVLTVNIPRTARFLDKAGTGRASFLTGFGMGFLAFALKKLLLPVFIGAQLLKSVLIAMFLPSLLGGVGKLLGKGLSTFSGLSGASTGFNGINNNNNNNDAIEDFEFKDTSPYNNEDDMKDFDGQSDTLSLNVATTTAEAPPSSNSRFGIGNQRISYFAQQNDNYYLRKPSKKTDYKVFHKIPSSSVLLAGYDPFYSPLLSRLDAVFQQLGLVNDKSPQSEKCRERLVCLMYANPAKYAPYSNLVSAQLSRELNELRKPSSDNPDILRFFRYMKAAKDGQDGEKCLDYDGCAALSTKPASPAILTTFNDINKLVLARKLK